MNVQLGVLIPLFGLLCTAAGLAVGLFTFSRNRDKDIKNEVKTDATESAVIRTKLDNISQGVDLIRIDMKASEMRVTDLSERVTRVEESSKSAHRRIDKLEVESE